MDETERENQKQSDQQAVQRLATKFVTDALTQVIEKGDCEIIADVHVTVALKLSKKNSEQK